MKEHLWEVQAAKSFCKMKKDWLSHERIHLSFVKHSGKPECKQELVIEGAIKLAGTDGAVNLSYLILTGRLRKIAEMKKKEAAEKQQRYVDPLFTSMGGTVASRSADGASCTFREFAVLCVTRAKTRMPRRTRLRQVRLNRRLPLRQNTPGCPVSCGKRAVSRTDCPRQSNMTRSISWGLYRI